MAVARVRVALVTRSLHLAVVEEQPVAGLERRENFRMRQLDPLARSRRRLRIEHEDVAGRDLDLAAGESSDPELRSLKIGEDADRPAELLLDVADQADERPAAWRGRCGSC